MGWDRFSVPLCSVCVTHRVSWEHKASIVFIYFSFFFIFLEVLLNNYYLTPIAHFGGKEGDLLECANL